MTRNGTPQGKHYLVLVALATVLALSACSQVRPNAVSTLDNQAYTTLTVANAAIDQAKAELTAGTLPAKATTTLNDAIAAYNVARAAWLTYRHTIEALSPGSVAPADVTAQLQSSINALAAAITGLQALGK